MLHKTELIPTYCAAKRCNRWGRWTLFLLFDDGSEDRVHFCRKHGVERQKELAQEMKDHVLRRGNGVLKS